MGVMTDVKVAATTDTGELVTIRPAASQPPSFFRMDTVDGQQVFIDPSVEMTPSTDILVVCDGSGVCGHAKPGEPCSVGWNQEAVGSGESDMPDAAYGIVTIELFDGKKYSFLSHACAADFLKAKAPLLPPAKQLELVTDIGKYKSRKAEA